ncbi:MAG: FAD-dependent monooxygenase [Devosia nanyangense]|uniref:FAD-dependent monooxygenase n=1 Tax=Devosia nanyangense TaxID=1228055 RepID=A0A933KZQ4_9HYPH|nr:FAD-dependent monooxygenase [Devosia nanyangense]
MANGGRTIYIAGAGIAGMTLALALAKFGATVIVLERNKRVQEVGAGLQISPNARRVLNQLGLDKAIAAKSFEPSAIDVYPFRASKPAVSLELGAIMRQRYGVPYVVMHRADLVDALYRACRRFANIDMLFGVRGFDAVTHARGISINVDEANGTARTARVHAFVGADGVHSETRTRILGGPPATYSGFVAWRTTLSADLLKGAVALDRTTLLLGPGYHAVCYPLPQRKQVNVALFVKERADRLDAANPPKEPKLPWAAMPSRTLDAIVSAATGAWGYWVCNTMDAPTWSDSGIGLIGDAAHAMLPFQAQGAAMAIEDAAILAPLLMTEPDADSAFRRYEAMRRPRVDRVRKISDFNGFAYHLEWPFTLGRNAVLWAQGPRGHLKRLDWIYGFDPSPETDVPPPDRAPRDTEPHRG